MSFSKLDSGIVDSTLWMQPHDVLRVWIAMLAKADSTGYVRASVPSMAHLCMVPIDRMEAIIETLTSPDKYSRSPDDEGRRLRSVDGGWHIVNYSNYRNRRDADARKEYQREWDRKKRAGDRKHDNESRNQTESDSNPTESDSPDTLRQLPTQAEAEAEAEIKNPPYPPAGGKGDQHPKSKSPTAGITFAAWLTACDEAGEKPIPASDPLFQSTEDAGIPREFVRLAWWVWSRDYDDGGPSATRRQKDWRAHFRNAIRRNWLKLWWFDPQGQCQLTTAGIQAQRERNAERERDSGEPQQEAA